MDDYEGNREVNCKKSRTEKIMYLLKVSSKAGAKPVEFLTMGEVAKLCKKSRDALKKLTDRGILPDANFRTPNILVKSGGRQGQFIEGYRLYSKDILVPKLVPYIKKNIKKGVLITREQRLELIEMFKEERTELLK